MNNLATLLNRIRIWSLLFLTAGFQTVHIGSLAIGLFHFAAKSGAQETK